MNRTLYKYFSMKMPLKFRWSLNVTIGLLLGVVVVMNLSLGIPRLAKFSAIDERLWTYDRIPQFWRAIEKGEWKKTDINDKPGITVALTSGVGLLFSNPKSTEMLRTTSKDVNDLAKIYQVDTSFRLPIYLFTLCMMPVFFWLIRRLFESNRIAFFATAFIFLSPILLGISLIVNPDSLLWIFLPLSLVSFLIFLKEEDWKCAVMSGGFLGFALLTKYVSTILFPFLFLLVFLVQVFPLRKYVSSVDEKSMLARSLRIGLMGYLCTVFVACLTVFGFYPVVWVSFNTLLQTTILSRPMVSVGTPLAVLIAGTFIDVVLLKAYLSQKIVQVLSRHESLCRRVLAGGFLASILFVFTNVYLHMRWINFPALLASPKAPGTWSVIELVSGAFTGLYGLLFGITPIVSLFFFLTVISLLGIRSFSFREEHRSIVLILLVFMGAYYAASAVNFVDATVRYQISLYPLAFIVAAVGALQCFLWIRAKLRVSLLVFSCGILLCSLASLLLIRPFYFSYASVLLPKQYVLNMKGMGDGSYEASQYLNSLPNAQSLSVWTDEAAVCDHFVGHCISSVKQKNVEGQNFDYFVISLGRRQKSIGFSSLRQVTDPDFLWAMRQYDSENFRGHQISIGGRAANFIKIIRNESQSRDAL